MKESCVMSCRQLTLQAFAFGVCLMSAAVSYAAEPVESVWVGGASGSASVKTNWDPQVVPTSTDDPYVIVFTNSVTVLNDLGAGYWYLQGIKVRNNASVIIKGTSGNNRIQTWNVKSDGFVVDVGEGCSLTHAKGDASDYAFYGQGRPVIKTGNGVFKTGSRLGWSNDYISSLEVREGILDCSIAAVRVKGEIKVCSGATLKVKSSGVVAGASGDATLLPWLNVAEGGVFDGCGANQRLLGLEGAGTVTNVSDLSLTMKYTEKVFSGRIHADILSVTNNSWTASGASMVLGSADTLQGVKRWRFTNDDAVPMEIRFAAGIETAAVGGSSYPTDRTFFNLDGMPVQLEYVNAAWYVDDDNYGKSGDGTTPEKAFGTLQEAMDNELLENYDTVYVLPGTYDKGGKPYGSYSTTNRVIVPKYVRLVATGSPEETVIVGRSSTDAAKDGLGNGPGAIRCVTLVGNTSSIRGFTLTGGRVTVTEDTKTGGEDRYGGAVWGGGNGSTVADCIISNNAAVRAGGVRNCTSVRCIATGNRASTYLGSVWFGVCDLYGCVEYGNPSSTKYAYYSVDEGRRIVNCTFGPGQTNNFRVTKSPSVILNSVFLGGIHTAEVGTYSNCVFACNLDGNLVNADEDCVIETGLETPAERLAFAGLDADLRPLKGGLVVDRGVNAYYGTHRMSGSQSSGPFDIAGAQRVSNGTIDIGAYEYDWRGDYTLLSGGGTRMPVSSATAGVVTNETGFVLADRDVVKVSCRKKTGIYSVLAKVTGSGMLTVSVAGGEAQTLTEAAGQTRLSFDVSSVPAEMRLGFDGEGNAEIVRFEYPVAGLVFVVK